jgi:hypothetical protein
VVYIRDMRLAAVLLLVFPLAVTAEVPAPSRDAPVMDSTGTLQPATVNALQTRLLEYERSSGNQVTVLMIPTTAPEELPDFGDRVLRSWHMAGPKRRGVLLLWSAEGQIAMSVSRGLEEQLPIDTRVEIFRAWIIPRFADGDPDKGIRDGVERIIAVLAGEPVGAPKNAATAGEAPAYAAEPQDDAAATDESTPDESAPVEAATEESAPEETASAPESPSAATSELDDIARGLDQHPRETIDALLATAREQLVQLPSRVDAIADDPDASRLAKAMLYVLAGIAVLAGLTLLSGKVAPAALWLGLGGALPLWLATGYTALALCLAAGAVLFCVLLPVAKVLLASLEQSPRIPDNPRLAQNERMLQQQVHAREELLAKMRVSAAATAAQSTPRGPATMAPPAAPRPVTSTTPQGAVPGLLSALRQLAEQARAAEEQRRKQQTRR